VLIAVTILITVVMVGVNALSEIALRASSAAGAAGAS